MIVSIIVALAENNVIGKDNDLIWRLPNDMKFFKETTQSHHVITGRKNYESIPEKFRPLPNRTNIVITRNKEYDAPGAEVFSSIQEALDFAKSKNENEVFIIGGGEIYKQGLPLAHKLFITHVHEQFEGDTYFPEVDYSEWTKVSEKKFRKDERHKYDFSICCYEKN